jgi:hypothetical protein
VLCGVVFDPNLRSLREPVRSVNRVPEENPVTDVVLLSESHVTTW